MNDVRLETIKIGGKGYSVEMAGRDIITYIILVLALGAVLWMNYEFNRQMLARWDAQQAIWNQHMSNSVATQASI